MKLARAALVSLLPLAAMAIANCGDDSANDVVSDGGSADDGGVANVPGQTFSAVIGRKGGSIVFGPNTLFIPPEQVTTDTTFTVTVKDPKDYPKGAEVLGPIYELGPSGFQFQSGATLSLKADKRPPAGEVAVIATIDPATNQWAELERSHEVGDVAAGKAQVVGRTGHFSPFTTWHVPNRFDERCRAPMTAGVLGINKPDTLNIAGATLEWRQKSTDGAIEYGSYWTINQPTVTISGEGMIDGSGRWGAWMQGQIYGKKPEPRPFPIVGQKWSFTANIKELVEQNYVNISVDDYCPGDYDIGWVCGPACMGIAPQDGGADTGGPTGPFQCQVGFANPATASPRTFAVSGNKLLGGSDLGTAGAFSAWTLINPTAPVLLDSVDLNESSRRQIATRGNTAFITDGARIVAIDFSDPANLALVGSYNLDQDAVLKAALGNPVNGVKAFGIAISGNHAYVAASDRGFVVVDVTNPAAMSRVAHLTTGSSGARDVVISGTKAYVTSNEIGLCLPSPCVNHRGVMVFDITNPLAPAKGTNIDVAASSPNSIAVAGNYLYLADGNTRLVVVDLATGAVVGAPIATNGFAYQVQVAGSKLYVSSNSQDAHLQVYSLANPAGPTLLTDENVAPTGGGYAVTVSSAHAYVGSIGKISVIDLRCP
jgi:hypothetical protein